MVKNENKLHKISENEIQTHFQERFFEKKILEKLEEYINYYRDISRQMNYCVESGKIEGVGEGMEGEEENEEDGEGFQGQKGRRVEKAVKFDADEDGDDDMSKKDSSTPKISE